MLLGASAAICTAQNPVIAPIGLIERDGTAVLSQPSTTIHISLTVEKETLSAGPYARYAMKYLGVTAPLTDKTVYSIIGCTVSDREFTAEPENQDCGRIRNTVAAMQIDKLSNEQMSQEQRAAEAANKIFALRRSRLDLITGEAGENVFGQGLDAALKEISRLEEEYTALFLGKRTMCRSTEYFSVVPNDEQQTYIICRFDQGSGILESTDLSGTPVLLDISVSPVSTEGITIVAKPGPKDRLYRIAGNADCNVMYKDTRIGSRTVPVYQLGRTVAIQSK